MRVKLFTVSARFTDEDRPYAVRTFVSRYDAEEYARREREAAQEVSAYPVTVTVSR